MEGIEKNGGKNGVMVGVILVGQRIIGTLISVIEAKVTVAVM